MTSPLRRLSAIVFTDMVGYTARMASDEAGAVRLLARHDELIRDEVAKTRARVIKTIGDSFMLEFPSAVDAVECASLIQKRFAEHNRTATESERILVRIGIHIGDVVVTDDGDLIGDGVNIASRLQPLASPGGICVSKAVFDAVRAQERGRRTIWKSLGAKRLKGVEDKLQVYETEMEIEGLPGKACTRVISSQSRFLIAAILVAACSLIFLWTRSQRMQFLETSSKHAGATQKATTWELVYEDDFQDSRLWNDWYLSSPNSFITRESGVLTAAGWPVLLFSRFRALDGCRVDIEVSTHPESYARIAIQLNRGSQDPPSYYAPFFVMNSTEGDSRVSGSIWKTGLEADRGMIAGPSEPSPRRSHYVVSAIYDEGEVVLTVDGVEACRYRDPHPMASIDNSQCGIEFWTTGNQRVKLTRLAVYRRSRGVHTSIDLALRMVEKGNYKTAMPLFEELAAQSGNPMEAKRAQYYLGACALLSGDTPRAIRELRRVTSDFPHDESLNSEAEYFLLQCEGATDGYLPVAASFIKKYPGSSRIGPLKANIALYLLSRHQYKDASRWIESEYASLLNNRNLVMDIKFSDGSIWYSQTDRQSLAGILRAYKECGDSFAAEGDTISALRIYSMVLSKNSFHYPELRSYILRIKGEASFLHEYAHATIFQGKVTVKYDMARSATIYLDTHPLPIRIKYGINDWKIIREAEMTNRDGVWYAELTNLPEDAHIIEYVFLDASGREIDKNGGINFRISLP